MDSRAPLFDPLIVVKSSLMTTIQTCLLVGVATVAVVSSEASAQVERPVAPSSWRPEAVSPPGVDARGDLNIQIPLLTVPGRGGMSYPVTLTYSSALPESYPSIASWVGTGWRFDPGSITREVFGGERRDMSPSGQGAWEVSYVDFAGSNPPFQPDRYTITLPVGGATLSPATQLLDQNGWDVKAFTKSGTVLWDHDNNPATPEEEYVGILPVETWYGGVVWTGIDPADTNVPLTPKGDYVGFVVTTPDGTRYVFNNPLIGTITATTGVGDYDYPDELARQFYVRSWGLGYILGPNTVGGVYASIEDAPDGEPSWIIDQAPSGYDSNGDWIIFEYKSRQIGVSSSDQFWQGATNSSFNEYRGLERVITPTHCLIVDAPWTGSTADVAHRLDTLELIRRSSASYTQVNGNPCSGETLRTVELNGNHLTGGGQPEWYTSKGSDGGPAELIHTFQYNSGSTNGGPLGHAGGDGWTLKSWTVATGGSIEIDYESDVLAPNTGLEPYANLTYTEYSVDDDLGGADYSVQSRTYTNRSTQGRRVKQMRMDPGDGEVVVTNYLYGDGILNAVPSDYLRTNFGTSGKEFLNRATNRVSADVYYTYVREEQVGGGAKTTFYTTPVTHPNSATRAKSLQWLWKNPINQVKGVNVAQEGSTDGWGQPYRIVYEEWRDDGVEGYQYCIVREVFVSHASPSVTGGTPLIWPGNSTGQGGGDPFSSFRRTEGARPGPSSQRVVDYDSDTCNWLTLP